MDQSKVEHCFQTTIEFNIEVHICRYIFSSAESAGQGHMKQEKQAVGSLSQCRYELQGQKRVSGANLGILPFWGPGRGAEGLGKWPGCECPQPSRGAWINVRLQWGPQRDSRPVAGGGFQMLILLLTEQL